MAIKSTSDLQAACLAACNACISACEACRTECLAANDPEMADCIEADEECAAACRACAEMLASGPLSIGILAECIAECDECASECDENDMESSAACARACRACMDCCQQMMGAMSSGGMPMKNNLKAISKTDSELRVGNYMVLFGGKDLVGEWFTKNTVFDSGYTNLGTLYVDFEHGQDPDRIGNDADCVLGTIDWKSAKIDETGIYVERVLSRQAQYMEFLEELINAGCMGTSSAAIPGKTTKKSSGEIVEWPLMRDSLTVTPMEPRMLGENVLRAAKSLHAAFPHAKSLARLCGLPAAKNMRLKTIEEIGDLNGAELYLREVGGVSRSEAKALVSRVLSIARREVGRSDESEELKAITALLEKQRTILTV